MNLDICAIQAYRCFVRASFMAYNSCEGKSKPCQEMASDSGITPFIKLWSFKYVVIVTGLDLDCRPIHIFFTWKSTNSVVPCLSQELRSKK